jgi:receptor expression-enhancing protein 5/6
VAWLVLPYFRGAAFVYDKFVREQLRKLNGTSTKEGSKPKTSSTSPKDKDNLKGKFIAFVTPKKVLFIGKIV